MSASAAIPASELVDLRFGIVAILNASGQTVGTGFVASASKVITCAHVVEDAGADAGETVEVRFHATGTSAPAEVERESWQPSVAADLCVLHLRAALPVGAQPLRLGHSALTTGRLHTFGYPAAKSVDGMPALCEAVGETVEGGVRVIQLRSDEVSYGFSGAPLWNAEAAAVCGVITSIIEADADAGARQRTAAYSRPIELVRERCADLRLVTSCPYRGLDRFEEEHAGNYFGRDAAIRELVDVLAQYGFAAVTGVSGSGKSSLLRAGLAKGIETSPGEPLRARRRVTFTPTQRPTVELERVVGDGSSPAIIVVDQFERLYTECRDAEERERFVVALLTRHAQGDHIVLGVRADFYGHVLQMVPLAQIVKRTLITLVPMTRAELHDAIVKPALNTGVAFQRGLAEQLVTDATGQAGDLPLLEFALTELWARDAGVGLLRTATYDDLGYTSKTGERFLGLHGAIAQRAEAVLATLTRGEVDRVRRIFLKLVVPQGDSAAVGTYVSRRAWQSEWDPATIATLQKLADEFLLVTGIDPATQQPTAEIPHESITRAWPRLQTWIKDSAPALAFYHRDFVFYLQRWIASGRRREFLLPRSILAQARRWRRRAPELFDGVGRAFLRRSHLRTAVLQGVGAVVTVLLFLLLTTEGGLTHRIKKLSVESALASFTGGLDGHEALGRVLDQQYYLAWFQRFDGGLIIHISGVHPLSSGGGHPTAGTFLLATEPVDDRLRWFLDRTPYQGLRSEEQFCAEFAARDPRRAAHTGFAALPTATVPTDCRALFRDGLAGKMEEHLGITGSIARVYAAYGLNETFGKPQWYECHTSLVVQRHERGYIIGGAPSDSCDQSDSFYALFTTNRTSQTDRGYTVRRAITPVAAWAFPAFNQPPLLQRLRNKFVEMFTGATDGGK